MNEPYRSLTDRLARFQATGDVSVIAGTDVGRDIDAVVRQQARDLETDVIATLAWLRWYRFLTSSDTAEREAAVRLFHTVSVVDPELVPGPLQDEMRARRASRERTAVEGGTAADPTAFLGRAREAGLLFQRSIETNDTAAMDRALELFRGVRADMPDGHLMSPPVMVLLGYGLLMQYERVHSDEVLDEAVALLRGGVERMPAGHELRSSALMGLAGGLQLKLMTRPDPALLAEVNAVAREAQECSAADSPMTPLITIAADMMRGLNPDAPEREQRKHDAALDAARTALAAAPPGDAGRPQALLHLGGLLAVRYEQERVPALLDEAETRLREAYETGGHLGEFELPVRGLLGTVLAMKAQANGEQFPQEALDLLGDGAQDLPEGAMAGPLVQSNLAVARWRRYHDTGEAADLDAAIETARRALDRSDADSATRPSIMMNLASGLQDRFRSTGDSAALSEAVALAEQARRAVQDGAPEQVPVLLVLAQGLQLSYSANGGAELLERAISVGRDAERLAHDGHPHRCDALLGFADSLRLSGEAAADPALLDEAAGMIRDAARASGGDPSPAAGTANPLAVTLLSRYVLTRDLADLDEAAAALRDAVAATPAGGNGRAECLGLLGHVLHLRHHHLGPSERASLQQARSALAEAFRAPHPTSRFVATAMELGAVAGELREWSAAAEAFGAGVGTLPRLAGRGLAAADRDRQLLHTADLAADAAACALSAGDMERAVELLEEGRAVQFAMTLETRSDQSALRAAAPALADRYDALRNRLELSEPEKATASWRERIRRLAGEWDALLDEIRRVPGMDGFLRPLGVRDLRAEAAGGAIVYLNVSRFRSDAIVVTPDGVDTVGLKVRFDQDADARERAFRDAVDTLPSSEETVTGTLEWLWDECVERVLEKLGHTGTPVEGERWPRIWWCPGGPLATLPVHAAGNRAGESALDRVVSSYIPTARALRHARGRERLTKDMLDRMLLVAMRNTPDADALPGIAEECAWLKNRFPKAHELRDDHAVRDAVLARLPEHPVAHFACHGTFDPGAPHEGRLLLHDHAERPLTIARLSALDLGGAALAYLSACETARVPAARAGEAVQLVSAFQLAGFANVVGSLWTVDDMVSRTVTQTFYEALTAGTGDRCDIAGALHRAVRALRSEGAAQSDWAPYVHAGI
ncbi:CHAT domain-containing protein [Actinomadura fibrosa]|uniref:CHAT domain-containing protein n=1 Tax=Actinomadura fibrosa TaxID=111802 RepID=A0ABW2XDQ2_9ACTN|nr:CHAT domain-containing protein [Actinomadura fibrosa]